MKYTKYTGNKAERELRGEESKEPGRGVQAGTDLLLLQVSVQVTMVVVQKSGQLVHLNLQPEEKRVNFNHDEMRLNQFLSLSEGLNIGISDDE